MSSLNESKKPRNGHALVVGVVARVSVGEYQKVRLKDQFDAARSVVAGSHTGPVEFRMIGIKSGSFEGTDLALVEAELKKDELDLLILNDLGRLARGRHAVRLLRIAVDHGTRVLSQNDGIDIAKDTWASDTSYLQCGGGGEC